MKHANFIPALSADFVNSTLGEGFTPAKPLAKTAPELCEHVYFAQRAQLENNKRFKQVLPYFVIRKGSKMFVYQRTSKVGENRLSGNFSVGVGGHGDLADIAPFYRLTDSATDHSAAVIDSLSLSALRELQEELTFSRTGGSVLVCSVFDLLLEQVIEESNIADYVQQNTSASIQGNVLLCTARLAGYINDNSNDVGLYHLGVVFTIDLDDLPVTVHMKEQELRTVGFVDASDPEQLATFGVEMDKMESWSQIVINNLYI